MSAVFRALAVSLVLAVVASPAAAGQQGYTSPDITLTPPPGWSLTPAMGVSQTWDDNVTLKGPGDNPVSDVINVVNPRAELNFNGPRGQLAARYDGAFLLYRSSTTLNSYEQHGSLAAKRRLSTRTAFFINGGASVAPTTELLQLTAVPYVRAGARTEDARVGIESALSKRLSIVADVHGQEVVFDDKAPFANLLLGGTSVGAGLVLRERLSEQTTLTADYDGLRADIGERHDIFVVQNATVGARTPADADACESLPRRAWPDSTPRRSVLRKPAPAIASGWRATCGRRSSSSFCTDRSFRRGASAARPRTKRRPSSFACRCRAACTRSRWCRGGTTIRSSPSRRRCGRSGFRPRWGTPRASWARIEGYYLGTRQTVVTPDELLTHNQIGFQVIASKPVRLR